MEPAGGPSSSIANEYGPSGPPEMNARASSSVYGRGTRGSHRRSSGSWHAATIAGASSSRHGRRVSDPSCSSTPDPPDRPAVAVGVLEEHEAAPREVLDVADGDAAARQLVVGGLRVFD